MSCLVHELCSGTLAGLLVMSTAGCCRVAEPSSISEEPANEALPAQAALRLDKARVSALQSEVASLQTQLKDKDKRLDASEKGLRQLQMEKAAWQKQQKAFETQVGWDRLSWAMVGTGVGALSPADGCRAVGDAASLLLVPVCLVKALVCKDKELLPFI